MEALIITFEQGKREAVGMSTNSQRDGIGILKDCTEDGGDTLLGNVGS
jgi:hypothetical protein